MLGRPEGLNRLDTSLEGFWRSFAAIILVAPFALLALDQPAAARCRSRRGAGPLTGGGARALGVALLVDWFAFPLIFALLAPTFGLGSRYVPFIVARNWASVDHRGDGRGRACACISSACCRRRSLPYALLVALAIALRFSYVIARTTLAVSMAMALPIVILDFLISLVDLVASFDRLGLRRCG